MLEYIFMMSREAKLEVGVRLSKDSQTEEKALSRPKSHPWTPVHTHQHRGSNK
jgi:hypothetical protein